MYPSNAIAAVSHPDPYPWYRHLLAGPTLYFDAGLDMWIASRASVIREVLDHPLCLVRPIAEPVPATIAGSSAGAVFAKLIRMNENAAHAMPKRAIGQALATVNLDAVARNTDRFAAMLQARPALTNGTALTRWMVDLPTYVVSDLLGLCHADLPRVAQWMAQFVRCLSPLSSTAQLADASAAAHALYQRFTELAPTGAGLMAEVARQAAQLGWTDHDAILANLIGLLSQTHEASAGLIGNSIVALLSQPQLQAQLRADPRLAAALVQEVARFDPPVQNTRRFVAQATSVAGVALQPGASILLLLAAAGRDQEAHAEPDVFLLERPAKPLLAFGHGRHGCPGQALARRIATAAVQHLVALPFALDPGQLGWTYRASANGRLPQFFTFSPKEQP